MSAEHNHKTWAAADFERYHSGKMPEAEMHALEKAALEDPFLEDALEGYALTKTPVADISQLQQKLLDKNNVAEDDNEKGRVLWFRSKGASQLFKAAAILIIFGGLAYFLFNNKNKPSTDAVEIAAVDNTIKKDTGNAVYNMDDSVPAIAKLDDNIKDDIITKGSELTTPTREQASVDIASTKVHQEELIRNANISKDKQAYTVKPAATQNASIKSERSNAPAPVESKEVEQIAGNKNLSEIKGRVVDNNGNAVPFATIRNNTDARQQSVAADINGNFSLQNTAGSNTANVEVNAVGYETAQTNLANNSVNNTIVLNQGHSNLSEVAVTQNAKKTQAPAGADYYYDESGKKVKYAWNAKNTYIQLRNASPLEGWPYFYYVMNDSLITKDSQFNQHNGKITLQFDIDNAGAVQNIIVVKSLNDTADAAAKNILLKSPVLRLNNKQKKAEAVIKFGL